MRPIVVSIEVFAALWARRKPGEDSENDILARLLALPRQQPMPDAGLVVRERGPRHANPDGGIVNTLFQVKFPQGFEIFRSYKGKEYLAVVQASRWIMEGKAYPSLFALSQMVSDSNENPWMHWKYRDEHGQTRKISDLRGSDPVTAPLPGDTAKASRQTPVRKKNARR